MHATENSNRVLLIEDNPGDVRLISEMLQEVKERKTIFEHSATLTQGLQALSKNEFNILLLDLNLPDSKGFDTYVKVYTQYSQIPIIILTGTNDEELAMKSVRTGAQDYLIKGQIDSMLLSRSISYAIERAGLLKVVQQELIERKAMESVLRKINRALRMLSECNEIVVRATEEDELAKKICSAIATVGEYKFVWIAFIEGDAKSIRPIATSASKDWHSSEVASEWFKRDTNSLLSEALNTGKMVVCDDVKVDKRCSNLKTEADKLGYRSFVVLPLVIAGKAVGVVNICSQEPNRFDREELKLLEELKDDVSYAVVSIKTEKKRKRAEEKLIESENKYRSLFENSLMAISTATPDGSLIQVNSAYALKYGYDNPDEMIANVANVGQLYANPEDRKEVLRILAENGSMEPREIEVVRRDGTRFFVLVSAQEIKDDRGNVLYSLANHIDITERKQAQEALRESEEKFEAIYQNSNDAIMLLNKNGFIDCNLQTLKMFKIKEKEEFIKFRPDEVSPNVQPDGKNSFEAVQENISIAYRDGYNHFDWIHRRFDGEDFYTEVLLTSFNIGGEQVLQATVRDVTERKQAEQELFDSERRFRATFEQAPIGIAHVSPSGQWLRVNQRLCDILGYTQKELFEKNFGDITHPDDRDQDIENSRLMVEDQIQSYIREKRYIRKDGLIIHINLSVSLVHKPSGEPDYFISVIEDVTKRKQLEAGLRQMQKLEGLGTLAGGIAHDFNNILGIILAYITSTTRFKNDSKKLDLAVDTIVNAVERGKTLVQQILTFARKTETSFGAVKINDVAMEIVTMIYEMFPKMITCSQNFDKSVPYINADRSQLHQVLMNLCVNARDAMPKGGILTITTHLVSNAILRNQHPEASASSYVCIEVNDTGEGMSEETRNKIFEPFFTTKEKGKGTGLGLAVVYGIVQSHKGFIDVESKLGKGTTFLLYFPVSKIQEVIKVKDEKTLEDIPGGTETLLVVEDEEMLMMSLQMMLAEKGYKVIPAKDGLEAVNIYKKRKNEISLVMTDLGLPKLSGMEECAQIKKYNPNARMILATGFLDPEMKSEFLKAGIQHFLYKPYDLKKVLKEIREVLDEK
jgi:PAS domain S-box-containing protein